MLYYLAYVNSVAKKLRTKKAATRRLRKNSVHFNSIILFIGLPPQEQKLLCRILPQGMANSAKIT